jgi:hypothetical protein
MTRYGHGISNRGGRTDVKKRSLSCHCSVVIFQKEYGVGCSPDVTKGDISFLTACWYNTIIHHIDEMESFDFIELRLETDAGTWLSVVSFAFINPKL